MYTISFLRISEQFHNAWSTFLELSIKSNPGPALYQYVTQSVLTIYIKTNMGFHQKMKYHQFDSSMTLSIMRYDTLLATCGRKSYLNSEIKT